MVLPVALSFRLPFVLIPLVLFTSWRRVMGVLVDRTPTIGAGLLAAVVVLVLTASCWLSGGRSERV